MTDESPSHSDPDTKQPDSTSIPVEESTAAGFSTQSQPVLFGDSYEIIGELGQGGMGSVLKARHQRLQSKIYAIKVLNPALMLSDPTVKQRFEIEAQATAKLAHPNLVTVFDYGFTPSGAPYLVMEFLDGCSLDRALKSDTKLSTEELLPVFIQVTKALQYIHSQNIVHRDLKPHNIMVQLIGNERYAKLIDLGIAKVFSDDGTTAQHLTATGAAFGSPHYMSPEQCKGEKIDPRSDVYSFGCVMYECLAERPPFQGENSLQTLYKQVTEQPPPLDCKSELERELAIVIERCMQKTQAHRFQNATELLNALNKIEEESRQSNRPARSNQVSESPSLVRPQLKIQLQSQIPSQASHHLRAEPQPESVNGHNQYQRRPPPQPHLAAPQPADPAPTNTKLNQFAVIALVAVGVFVLGWFSFQAFGQLKQAPAAVQGNAPNQQPRESAAVPQSPSTTQQPASPEQTLERSAFSGIQELPGSPQQSPTSATAPASVPVAVPQPSPGTQPATTPITTQSGLQLDYGSSSLQFKNNTDYASLKEQLQRLQQPQFQALPQSDLNRR